MEQTTVRLPDDLKKCIAATGRAASDVIRDALREYFRQDSRPATVDYVRQCIDEHIRTHHSRDAVEGALVRWSGIQESGRLGAKITDGQGQIDVPEPETVGPSQVEVTTDAQSMEIETVTKQQPVTKISKKLAKKEAKRESTIAVLESLLRFFERGVEPVSGNIAKEIGLDAKVVGRLLHSTGMEPKNTRVHDISGRYWRYDCQPIAEAELKRLKAEIEGEKDEVIGEQDQGVGIGQGSE